jgi:hypothetical protein
MFMIIMMMNTTAQSKKKSQLGNVISQHKAQLETLTQQKHKQVVQHHSTKHS